MYAGRKPASLVLNSCVLVHGRADADYLVTRAIRPSRAPPRCLTRQSSAPCIIDAPTQRRPGITPSQLVCAHRPPAPPSRSQAQTANQGASQRRWRDARSLRALCRAQAQNPCSPRAQGAEYGRNTGTRPGTRRGASPCTHRASLPVRMWAPVRKTPRAGAGCRRQHGASLRSRGRIVWTLVRPGRRVRGSLRNCAWCVGSLLGLRTKGALSPSFLRVGLPPFQTRQMQAVGTAITTPRMLSCVRTTAISRWQNGAQAAARRCVFWVPCHRPASTA